MKLPKWLRIALPSIIIVGWLAVSALGAPFFGKIGDLSSTDLRDFLSKNAESSKANDQVEKFYNKKGGFPLIIVFDKYGQNLVQTDMERIADAGESLVKVDGVVERILPPIESKDAKAAIVIVPVGKDFKNTFPALKQKLADAHLSVRYAFTGPAAFGFDLQNGFSGIDSTLLYVAVAVVFIILLAVYRSPFLPFIVLGSAVVALSAAVFVVYHLAKAGTVQMNGQVQGILFILVIGAATDYSLLFIARYREELTNYRSVWKAGLAAWRSSLTAIIAAGGTVSVGLLCLLFSGLGSNRALGPVGGIGIAFSVLVSLTLLPALLVAFGRTAFWPRKPKYVQEKAETHYKTNHPVWSRIGAFIQLHPRRIWIVSAVFLLAACVGITQLKADGVPQSSIVLGKSEARDGQQILDAHFPSGSGTPAYVLADQSKAMEVIAALDRDKGIDSVAIVASDSDSTSVPVGRAGGKIRDEIKQKVSQQRDQQLAALRDSIDKQMAGLPQAYVDAAYAAASAKVPSAEQLAEQANPFTGAKAKTVDGKVLLQATLTDPVDSLTARDTILRLRDGIRKVDSNALIGGNSAAQLDTNVSSQQDLHFIVPMILLAITVILMFLLRAIVAPLVLLLSTVLSFGATMGIAAFVFNNIWHFAGADPTVLIMAFVFLVALGIDYNIFLMTRVREETVKLGVAKGTIKGLVVTGGVITSAGIVLAATFASLGVIPILYLAEIAFIVTFGVLLDTIVVRSLLVPAITLEIGNPMWWSSKLWRKSK